MTHYSGKFHRGLGEIEAALRKHNEIEALQHLENILFELRGDRENAKAELATLLVETKRAKRSTSARHLGNVSLDAGSSGGVSDETT